MHAHIHNRTLAHMRSRGGGNAPQIAIVRICQGSRKPNGEEHDVQSVQSHITDHVE